jgi:hypothetical protein
MYPDRSTGYGVSDGLPSAHKHPVQYSAQEGRVTPLI